MKISILFGVFKWQHVAALQACFVVKGWKWLLLDSVTNWFIKTSFIICSSCHFGGKKTSCNLLPWKRTNDSLSFFENKCLWLLTQLRQQSTQLARRWGTDDTVSTTLVASNTSGLPLICASLNKLHPPVTLVLTTQCPTARSLLRHNCPISYWHHPIEKFVKAP